MAVLQVGRVELLVPGLGRKVDQLHQQLRDQVFVQCLQIVLIQFCSADYRHVYALMSSPDCNSTSYERGPVTLVTVPGNHFGGESVKFSA